MSDGSGWEIVDKHEVDVSKYEPLRGSSYLPLPEKIKNKNKGLINIKNENDNDCFRWCHLVLSIFCRKNNPQRIAKYKGYINKVNYDGIPFPVKLNDIPKIENLNGVIRFNVYDATESKSDIYPLYISNKICDKTCNLLLIENGDNSHYVRIKEFNKLMNSQSKDTHRLFLGYYYLQHFTSEIILKKHAERCLKINGAQKVKMPKK